MGGLAPRKRSNLSRSRRVDRGYHLTVATGVSAIAFVIVFVLALIGTVGGGLPLALAAITAACGYGAYRTIRS